MDTNGNYIMYLRKSRADLEAEARGEGETLSRHQRILTEYAQKLGIYISPDAIYREIVSGETIAARPVMQRLLAEVERGEWDGVFVMEVERLARGDTIDQGIVARAFQLSGTKIITPQKVYDPNNEFDEEYFEFGLYMSRREYKTIRRRMQAGRVASVKEGKYVGNKPPYGYDRRKIEGDKGWYLVPNPEQSPVVKQIFSWYAYGRKRLNGTTESMGVSKIARELTGMQIPTPSGGKVWSAASIKSMLYNPTYAGKLRWGWRAEHKSIKDGQIVKSRPRAPKDQWMLSDGRHEPLVSEELFDLVQSRLALNPTRPAPKYAAIKNPLANIIVCGFCGHRMQRRPYASGYGDTLICTTIGCKCVSASLAAVEDRLLQGLREWVDNYRLKWQGETVEQAEQSEKATLQTALESLEKNLVALQNQRDRIFTLYEQGEYSGELFAERRATVESKIQANKEQIENARELIKKANMIEQQKNMIIPKVEHILEVYHSLPTAQDKNDLLRSVIEYVEYTKTERGGPHRKVDPNNFKLVIHPRIPENR